jgi:hypothetical protein
MKEQFGKSFRKYDFKLDNGDHPRLIFRIHKELVKRIKYFDMHAFADETVKRNIYLSNKKFAYFDESHLGFNKCFRKDGEDFYFIRYSAEIPIYQGQAGSQCKDKEGHCTSYWFYDIGPFHEIMETLMIITSLANLCEKKFPSDNYEFFQIEILVDPYAFQDYNCGINLICGEKFYSYLSKTFLSQEIYKSIMRYLCKNHVFHNEKNKFNIWGKEKIVQIGFNLEDNWEYAQIEPTEEQQIIPIRNVVRQFMFICFLALVTEAMDEEEEKSGRITWA